MENGGGLAGAPSLAVLRGQMGWESRGCCPGSPGIPLKEIHLLKSILWLWALNHHFLKTAHFSKEEMNLLSFIPHSWITYRSHLELNINTVHQCRPCSKWRTSRFSRLQTLNVRWAWFFPGVEARKVNEKPFPLQLRISARAWVSGLSSCRDGKGPIPTPVTLCAHKH